MVGGVVFGTRRTERYRYAIGVQERHGTNRLWIDVEYREGGAAVAIEPGDTVWWQGDFVYWTPKGGRLQDHKIKRLSYSHEQDPGPAGGRPRDGGEHGRR
jgi:hypothetical protein